MARPSRRRIAAAIFLIASLLACNMPSPSRGGNPVTNLLGGGATSSMSLDEAVNTPPDDRREQVLSLMGAPDAFSLHWEPVAGKDVRWEEWSYFDAGARFDFVDGELVWTADLDPAPDGSLYAHQYDPTAFHSGDSLDDLQGALNILAPQDLATVALDEADVPGGTMVAGDQILMGFDNGRLVSVDTFILAPEGGATSGSIHGLASPPAHPSQPASRPVPVSRQRSSGFAGPSTAGGIISKVVPFVGFFVGWSHRNHIYRQAENFVADRNDYYDSLRDTARKQLINRDVGGLRPSQVAAYTKLVAMIEDQRKAELAVAEASKNEARQAFNKRVEGIITQRLLGAGMVQRVFGAVTKGLNSSQNLLDNAIQNLSGNAGGILGQIQHIQSTARDIERWASAIGGPTGAGLRAAAGRIASSLEHPQDLVKADLEKVQSDLTDIQDTVDTLNRAGRTPSAGALAQGLVFGPASSDDPAVQAVTILVSKLSVGDGSLKEKAQAALDAGFVGRCAAIADAYRAALDRLQSGTGEAMSAEQAAAPCRAIDVAQLAQQPSPTQAAGEPTGQPTEASAQAGETDTGLEASISVVSVNFGKSNCDISSVNGWHYCDVTEDLVVAYQTASLPAAVECFMLQQTYTTPLTQASGQLSLHDEDLQRNVDVMEPNFLQYCNVLVGDQVVANTQIPKQ